jgi:hypothetical protein
MISAKQCRIYAAECMARASSSIIANRRSLEQSIMALNWSALADEIDRENGEPDWRRSFAGCPLYSSNLERLTRTGHQAGAA